MAGVGVANEVGGHAANRVLQWFVGEQVEEANVGEAVQQLRIARGYRQAVLMRGRGMGGRVFSVPASAPWYPKPGQPGSATG